MDTPQNLLRRLDFCRTYNLSFSEVTGIEFKDDEFLSRLGIFFKNMFGISIVRNKIDKETEVCVLLGQSHDNRPFYNHTIFDGDVYTIFDANELTSIIHEVTKL